MIRLGVSIGVTGLLALGWLGFLIADKTTQIAVQASVQEATPLGSISKKLKESGSSIGEKWNDLVNEVKINMEERKVQILNNQQQ